MCVERYRYRWLITSLPLRTQYSPKTISDIRLLFDRVDNVLAHVPTTAALNVRSIPHTTRLRRRPWVQAR
jgi:hypothetical protein